MSRNRLTWSAIVLTVWALALLNACGPEDVEPTPSVGGPLAGGVLATFDVDGEQFKVWVTNPETIQQLFDLDSGASQANIPNGRILRGAGHGDHNAPWSWHLDPEEVEMAEMTVEVCDGRPSYVEENVDEFVDSVQRYCPWAASLVTLEDYR